MTKPHILQMGAVSLWDEERLSEHFTLLRYFDARDKSEFARRHAKDIRAIATMSELGASASLIAALPSLENSGLFTTN